MNNNFAEWLKQELNSRHWSIRELGRRSPVSHSTVAKVINGSDPSWNFCAEIAPALDLSPIDMFIIAGKLNPKDKIESTLILSPEEDDTENSLILPPEEKKIEPPLDPFALQMAKEISVLPPKGRKAIFNTISPLLTEIRELTQMTSKAELSS